MYLATVQLSRSFVRVSELVVFVAVVEYGISSANKDVARPPGPLNIVHPVHPLATPLSAKRVKLRKEMFYLTTHSTHFIYGYMASLVKLRDVPEFTVAIICFGLSRTV